MQMTDAEIRESYRTAKNKRHQVKILAELNACGVDVITAILNENGKKAQKMPEKEPKTIKNRQKLVVPETKDKLPDVPTVVKLCIQKRVQELEEIARVADESKAQAVKEYGDLVAWASAAGINL